MPIFTSSKQSNYFSSYIDIKAISTPSSPNSGIGRIFHRSSDNKLCFKLSNGTVVELGGGAGTVTSASNVGAGSGWFKQLNGSDLEFKSLVAGTNQLSITSNTNDLTLDVVEANIKLDDLGTPDDNTDLNASVSRHGLLRKLSGTASEFLAGDGTWATPAGSGSNFNSLSGSTTRSGDASTTVFTIAHGAGTTPTYASVVPSSVDALGDYRIDVDDTNITITYQSAPPTGTNNLEFFWIISAGDLDPLSVMSKGSATKSGDSSTTVFTIAHGMTSTPASAYVVPSSVDALGEYQVDVDPTNITITYQVAPATGTNNLSYYWMAIQSTGGVAGIGEVNTASNTGSTGTGVFKQKNVFDLEFYKLASANNRLTVALSGTDYLNLTINEANFNLANLGGTAAWTQVSKSGSILDDIGDVNEGSPAQYDVVQRNGSNEWVGTKITNDNIDAVAAIATSKLADGNNFVTLTGSQTLTNKTLTSGTTTGTFTLDSTAATYVEYVKPKTDGAQELLTKWRLDEATSNYISFENNTSSNGHFIPDIVLRQQTSAAFAAGQITGMIHTSFDSGSVAAINIIGKTNAGALSTRPILSIKNSATEEYLFGFDDADFKSNNIINAGINATNNTITDTSTVAGDLLKSNGTKFVRLARGTALQVLQTNSGATDVAWATISQVKSGTASKNGGSTSVTIAHGMSSTPTVAHVEPTSTDAFGSFTTVVDATNITLTYVFAPPSGTGNLTYFWTAIVSI